MSPNAASAVQVAVLSFVMFQSVLRTRALDIAIIGGGISGTSTAYFLNEFFGKSANIDLFEGAEIGGRLSTLKIDENEYEIGGAVIHVKNKYASDLAEKMGLKKMPDEGNELLGIYQDNDYVFLGSRYSLINNIKMLWRYGYDLIRLQRSINALLVRFDRIYDIQNNNQSFVFLKDMINAMDPIFIEYMNISTLEGFEKEGFSRRIIDELIQATIKCNYGQTTSIHRFVGSVSVAGAGDLFSIVGGNKLLPQKLMEASKAVLRKEFVATIMIDPEDKKFVLVTEKGSIARYDAVIISSPMTSDSNRSHKIHFSHFSRNIAVPGKYWTTICTVVKGKINPKYFGWETVEEIPDLIISVSEDSPFNSIGKIWPVNPDASQHKKTDNVWKIFSEHILTSEQIDMMFTTVNYLKHIDWQAYPNYSIDPFQYNFTLYDNLFYTNAMEWSASAIETSIIGARNVALLVQQRFGERDSIRKEEHDEL